MHLSVKEKKDFFLISVILFGIFFSYPLIRSTTTSLFITKFGAKKSPYVWLYSVVCLSFAVTVFNKLLRKYSVSSLFIATSIFTFFIFAAGAYGVSMGHDLWSYILYIWKEAYIILLVHSVFAFVNILITEEAAKSLYGPLGAVGSLGGIIGGYAVTRLSGNFSDTFILMMGAIISCAVSFILPMIDRGDKSTLVEFNKHKKKESPFESIKGRTAFVLYLSLVVMMSQFVVNIANYEFNFFLEQSFPLQEDKTTYLGRTYGFINSLSLVTQFLVMPVLFKMISPMWLHFIVPALYLVIFLGSSIWGGLGVAFIFIKGMDYSLFSGAKELLYFSLNDVQRYGAKYITDMVVYRLSKGVISLALILVPTSGIVNGLFYGSLVVWLLALILLRRQS